MNLHRIAFPLAAAALAAFASGCVTERSHIVARGAGETVSGFSQDDIDSAVGQAVAKLNEVSRRYAKESGVRRIVNVKDVTNDTLSRGATAEMLSEQLGQSLREELTNGGAFIVYNEAMARRAAALGQSVISPEYVLFGKLQQRNMRRDDGNVYQEFSLNLQLVDVATSLEIWQTRIPLQKGVAKKNAMLN